MYDKTKLRPHTDHSIIKKKHKQELTVKNKVFSFLFFLIVEKNTLAVSRSSNQMYAVWFPVPVLETSVSWSGYR